MLANAEIFKRYIDSCNKTYREFDLGQGRRAFVIAERLNESKNVALSYTFRKNFVEVAILQYMKFPGINRLGLQNDLLKTVNLVNDKFQTVKFIYIESKEELIITWAMNVQEGALSSYTVYDMGIELFSVAQDVYPVFLQCGGR